MDPKLLLVGALLDPLADNAGEGVHTVANSQLRPSTNVLALPFELLLHVFTHLSGVDITNFLSTSRSLHALFSDESIWRDLCSRFGVHDLSSFQFRDPKRTFFTVYTELLHTYGPLLGIWASDNVFQGNVLEFRIVTSPDKCGWEGIVGEVWRYQPRNMSMMETTLTATLPSIPEYYECLRIELLPPPASSVIPLQKQTEEDERNLSDFLGQGQWQEPDSESEHLGSSSYKTPEYTSRLIRFSWCLHDPIATTPKMALISASFCPIRLNVPHTQAYYIYKGRPSSTCDFSLDSSLHPPFPPLHPPDLWHDSDHPMPRLREHTEPVEDHRPLLPSVSVHSLVKLLYLAPLEAESDRHDGTGGSSTSLAPRPHSIRILPPPDRGPGVAHKILHNPPYSSNVTDLRRIQRSAEGLLVWAYKPGYWPEGSYFPVSISRALPFMRSRATRGVLSPSLADVHPSDDGWSPKGLEGLWSGSYSSHGTELLFVKFAATDTTRDTAEAKGASMSFKGEVQAWKITGDSNVPRGVLSWRFDTTVPATAPDENTLTEMDLGETGRAQYRLYNGVGTVSGPGFTNDTTSTIPLLVAVTDIDEIRIRWLFEQDVIYVPRYKRYRGRDIASEVVPRNGIRRPAIS